MGLNPRKLEPGTRVGPFTIRERLGRGATATVYKAEETNRGIVALKVLHADFDQLAPPDADGAVEDDTAERLKREVTLARRLTHPGVCRVYGLYKEAGLLFLSMELVVGTSLEKMLQTSTRLPVRDAARVLAEVSEAVAAAHAIDILHRDLKPGNVMLRASGDPVVLDFGYAVGPDVTRVTRTGVWVGTLCYAAPELLADEKASVRTDIFALGVTLYECLTGELPFTGPTYADTAAAVVACKPPSPRRFVKDLPAELEAVVLKCLRRDAHERFASALELARALRPFSEPPPPRRPLTAKVVTGESWTVTPTPTLAPLPSAPLPAPIRDDSTGAARRLRSTIMLIAGAAFNARYPGAAAEVARPLLAQISEWGGTAIDEPLEPAVSQRLASTIPGAFVAATFPTADDAVRAAQGMQRSYQRLVEANATAATALRIGIASGEVVWRNESVGGEAVDIAARACARAHANEVILSRMTHAAILAPRLAESCQPATPLERPGGAVDILRLDWGDSGRTAVFVSPLRETPPRSSPRPSPAAAPAAAKAPPPPAPPPPAPTPAAAAAPSPAPASASARAAVTPPNPPAATATAAIAAPATPPVATTATKPAASASVGPAAGAPTKRITGPVAMLRDQLVASARPQNAFTPTATGRDGWHEGPTALKQGTAEPPSGMVAAFAARQRGAAPTDDATAAAGEEAEAPGREARPTYAELVEQLQKEREARGLAGGDDVTADSMERVASLDICRGRPAEACAGVEKALARVRELSIDRAFVDAKIQRVDRMLRVTGALQGDDTAGLEKLLEAVMRAHEKGDYVAANISLNETIEELETRFPGCNRRR